MDTSLLLQYIAVALAAIVSAWVVAKKQFPTGLRKLRVAIALPLLRENRAAWLRMLGRKVAPESLRRDAACGGFDGCGK